MLNTIQQPMLATINKRIHSVAYPIHYTVLSDDYATLGFRYKFSINTKDGILATTSNAPSYTNGIGIFSPNSLLKNEVEYKFQPDILTITNVPNAAIQYRVDVSEVGPLSPLSTLFFKVWGLRNANEEFDYTDYVLNSNTGNFLTTQSHTQKVCMSDRGSIRVLSGTLVNTAFPQYTSKVYQYSLIKTNKNGARYFYTSALNPYYTNTNTVGLSNQNATLVSLDDYVIDIPAYPYNIDNMEWTYYARELSPGDYEEFTTPVVVTSILNDSTASYTICTWDANTNPTSKNYTFEIIDECNYPAVQLAWENKDGGTDYFTITKHKTKTSNSTKATYIKDKYQQGKMAGTYYNNYNYIGYNDLSKGESVYGGKVNDTWQLYTDWLSKDEIEYLEWLFHSPNTFMRIEDKWYPVTILNEKTLVETDKKGLKNFSIELRMANSQNIV